MTVLLAHAATSLYLTGTVWFAQLIHFPLFADVGEVGFHDYIRAHYRAFGWVIWPPLVVNLGTLVALAVGVRPEGTPPLLVALDVVLTVITVASTVGLQVPRLIALGRGYDVGRIRSLVRTNWLRTTTQTAAAAAAVGMLSALLP